MRRRALLVAGLSLPLCAVGGREFLRSRRAEFVEVGDEVRMSVALPELLLTRDSDAMASIESAFTTTLVYDVSLFRSGKARPISSQRRVVKIQWNPWKERFSVQISGSDRTTQTLYFTERDAAIAAAVTLDRIVVADGAELERGPKATYFVTVVGQRNPLSSALLPGDDESPGARGQGRDLSVFSRWIGMFIRDAPQAERTIAIRTVPAFYLVQR